MKSLFPEVRAAVAEVIDPTTLRWISFSHFEPDECGSLNEWLETAPSAQTVCTEVGAAVFVGDYAIRPPRALLENEVLETGKYRFRLYPTRHLPHGWDAGMMFEETNKTLFCSDLFHQIGDVEPIIESSVVERFRQAVLAYQSTPLMDYMPYTPKTDLHIQKLASLNPKICATMHGSMFIGDGARALKELGVVMKEVFG